MKVSISQKQIGQRISALRKRKGMSQENLAKKIKISRSSLVQIELGNRGVDILELQELAGLLEFSLDDLVSKYFIVPKRGEEMAETKPQPADVTLSIPPLNVDTSTH